MSETLLVRISGKRVYRDLEFEEDQREHRAAVQQKLMTLHRDVVAIMTNSYEVFKNDGPEVGGPVARALWVGRSSAPPVPSDPSLGLSPPANPHVLLKHPALVLDSPNLRPFKPPSFRTRRPVFLLNQLVPLSVGWFSFPRTCLVFPEGFSSPLLFPPDSAAVAAVHDSAGPHDGGCPAPECEVVAVGTVQGHQWGWKDHPQPTLPSPCHFEE